MPDTVRFDYSASIERYTRSVKLIVPLIAVVAIVAVAALKFGKDSSAPDTPDGVWELAGDQPG